MASVPKKAAAGGGRHRKPDRTEQNALGAVAVGQAAAANRGGGGRSKTRKPSTTRKAIGGAASGAATGAAVGSLVPGVGTAVGAGVGAVVGGGAGAVKGRSEKKDWKTSQVSQPGARRALIAEFLLCTIVLALSPLSNPEGKTAPKDWMKKGTALSGVFILLGMVSSVGPRAARSSVAIGGLITLVLVIDQRSIFGVIAEKMKKATPGEAPQTGPPSDPPPVSHPGDPHGDPQQSKPRRYQ